MNGAFATSTGLCGFKRLPLPHPRFERVERLQRRIDAERQRGALRRGGGIGEDAKARRHSP